MIALMKQVDSITRYGEFSITSAADLNDLPTTKKRGAAGTPVASINPVAAGSCAYTTDGQMDIYVLDGETDTWVLS